MSKKIHHYDSALAMAQAIREGTTTSRELVELHVSRIEKLDDGRINAIVQRGFEQALKQADEADAMVLEWKQDPSAIHLPVFCGVPMTVKASIPTPGFNVSVGDPSVWLPSWVECAATNVLLENSGVVLLGKSNQPFYMCDWECNNPKEGRTGNPYDPTRTPGGSSGGAAAALAAGFTPLELGSDIGGSVRIPAVLCGVVGHCATRDLVPAMELHNLMNGKCCSDFVDRLLKKKLEKDTWMGRYGPMARTVEDVTALLDVLGGEVAEGLPKPKPNSGLSDYRVALWKTHPVCPAGKEVSQAMDTAVATLKKAGATVVELDFPMDPVETYRMYCLYLSGFMKDHMSKEQRKNAKAGRPEDSYPSDIRSPFPEMDLACIQGIPEGTDEAYEKAVVVWNEHLKQYDAVLSPITPCPAWKTESEPRHMLAQAQVSSRPLVIDGEKRYYGEGLFWAHLSVLCGFPATGFPVQFSAEGLPVGLQAMGAKGNDYIVLDVVKHLTKELGRDVFRPPEGY